MVFNLSNRNSKVYNELGLPVHIENIYILARVLIHYQNNLDVKEYPQQVTKGRKEVPHVETKILTCLSYNYSLVL